MSSSRTYCVLSVQCMYLYFDTVLIIVFDADRKKPTFIHNKWLLLPFSVEWHNGDPNKKVHHHGARNHSQSQAQGSCLPSLLCSHQLFSQHDLELCNLNNLFLV